MSNVIPLDEFERKTQREHARACRRCANLPIRVEALADFKLREALPIAGARGRGAVVALGP
jgi:hypothetical protein